MTFVLVHGGGCDSRCWSPLIPHLDGPVIAVDLPGRGTRPARLEDLTVSDFVDAVVDDLEVHDLRDVVVVGHSLAGITLPGVAVAAPDRVAHLIFVSCAIPAPGTSIIESLGAFSPAAAEIADQIGGDVITANGTLHPDLATAMFCNDMDAEQVAFTLDLLVPESFNALSQPLASTGLPTRVPSTYIRLLRDASLSLETQTEMLARLGEPEIIDVDAGHLAMITQPVALAAVLNEISRRSPGG
jgi:pimeloyl-ACP methyl ester carboxylesterase